jgi:heme exporter protein D
MADFFHMGGYAFYVWTSYGLVLLVLVANLVVPVVRGRRFLQQMVRRARARRQP